MTFFLSTHKVILLALPFVFLLAALLVVLAQPAGAANTAGKADGQKHYVFAHYMVCYIAYGESLEGYKREIIAAQAAGIDGFALNEGAWTNEPHYVRRTKMLFQAAKELGTNFKLLFSLDLATLQQEYILEILRTYANDPSYFHYQGRPVVSTFGGELNIDWKGKILDPLRAEGINVCFVPFFYPRPNITELPDEQAVKAHYLKWADTVDGMFFFGAAGTDVQLAASNAAYTKVMHDYHKISMASFTPFYWGNGQGNGRRYYETEGGKGTELQWLSIIKSQPEWVEIVTWNDFNESYICPITSADLHFSDLFHPIRYDHAGYLELSKYYIQWYKTGKQPSIKKDALFYSYRAHPQDAKAAKDTKPVSSRNGKVQDVLYITTMLTKPAELRVTSGTVEHTLAVKSGIQHVQIPFALGNQHFALYRDGKCLITKDSDVPISDQIDDYDFFSVTWFGYAK